MAKDILETAAHLSQLLDGLLAMPSKKKNNTTAVRAQFNPTFFNAPRFYFSRYRNSLLHDSLLPLLQDNNSSALDLLGLDHVCRLIDILHRHDVRTDDSANAELEEEAARLNHDLEGTQDALSQRCP